MKQWCKNLCIVYECVAPGSCSIPNIRDSLREEKVDLHQTRARTHTLTKKCVDALFFAFTIGRLSFATELHIFIVQFHTYMRRSVLL